MYKRKVVTSIGASHMFLVVRRLLVIVSFAGLLALQPFSSRAWPKSQSEGSIVLPTGGRITVTRLSTHSDCNGEFGLDSPVPAAVPIWENYLHSGDPRTLEGYFGEGAELVFYIVPVGSLCHGRYLSTDLDHAQVTYEDPNRWILRWEDWTDRDFNDLVVQVDLEPEEEGQVELVGLEVTQGPQDWEHSVELIQGRPTFVRAHVKTNRGLARNVTAKLIGRSKGVELSDSPDSAPMVVYPNICRVTPNCSFLFDLPPSWISGTLELEFQGVSHTIACAESADQDGDCKATVSFIESPRMDLKLVAVTWSELTSLEDGFIKKHTPDESDMRAVEQKILSAFPVADVNPQRGWIALMGLSQPRDLLSQAWLALAMQRVFDYLCPWGGGGCTRRDLGILVDRSSGSIGQTRVGDFGDLVAVSFLEGVGPAHELGHAYGRRHTDYNRQRGISPAEEDPGNHVPADGTISGVESGDNAIYGFDIVTQDIYSPDSSDLMSYGSAGANRIPSFPSPWTYRAIRETLVSLDGQSGQSASIQGTGAAIVVSGVVTPTEQAGALQSVYLYESSVAGILPISGGYEVVLYDRGGHELARYGVEPFLSTVPCPDCLAGERQVGLFATPLPWDANASRVVLRHGGRDLDSRTVSSNSPTINIIYPNGGESLRGRAATLAWSASDPDGDPLKYVIQYSTDAGMTWDTLAVDWLSNTLELDLNTVAGTDQGLFRVLASDGLLTTQDRSDGVFSVAKHAPSTWIRTPITDTFYIGNESMLLEGRAYDHEDQDFPDSALSWTSSLNGTLGTGRSVLLNASNLTRGTHTITLAARDSDGQIGSSSVVVKIYREPSQVPLRLSVGPEVMRFLAVRGSGDILTRTLSIWNEGGGMMLWSATADQNWIGLEWTGGAAPADITVSAKSAGLSTGEHTGSITISAPGARRSPQIVNVTLYVREPYPIYVPVILKRGR